MNRTIKFRAWFNGKGKMVYNLGFDERSFTTLDDPTLEEDEMPSVWDKDCIVDDSYYEGAFSYELMQYTGLKDKNGVEIYEGDIVRFEAIEWTGNNGDRVEYQGVVEYSKKHIAFNFKIPTGLEVIPYETTNIEVIGNIYENKDLLKEEE